MIAAFLIMLSVAFGQTCEDPKSLPESMQVAWISPASKTVGMNGWIEAVRVADLRAWIRDNGKDKVRLLRGLGMVGARGGRWAAKRPYKVTIFDVKREWLCRPVEEMEPGTVKAGVTVCEAKQQRGLWGHKKRLRVHRGHADRAAQPGRGPHSVGRRFQLGLLCASTGSLS